MKPGTLLQEATADEKAAYLDALRGVMEQADQLDGQALQRTKELVAEMQERVLGRLHTLQDGHTLRMPDGSLSWSAFSLSHLRQAVEDVAHQLAQRYGEEISAFLPKAWDLGQDLIDAGAEVLSYGAPGPRLAAEDLAIAANWKPSLISDMSDFAKDRLGREIAVSVKTGEAPQELMKRLAGKITTDGTPFHSVAYRAELITRTEVKRINDLGNTKRLMQYDEAYPGELEVELLVAEVNGYPCETCSELAAQGPWKVGEAPSIPDDTHPCCRCDKIPSFKGMPKPDPADKPTEDQRAASVAVDTQNDEDAPAAREQEEESTRAAARGSKGAEDFDERAAVVPLVHPSDGKDRLEADTSVKGPGKQLVSWDGEELTSHLDRRDAAESDHRFERAPWLYETLAKRAAVVGTQEDTDREVAAFYGFFKPAADDDAEILLAFASVLEDGTMNLETFYTPDTIQELRAKLKTIKV